MNTKKSAADILREKYVSSQLKKTVIEKVHSNLNDLFGIEYLKDEMNSKLYNPLFCTEKYRQLGTVPPKSILLRGINGVGKYYIINCFCQHYQIPLITNFIENQKDIKELFNKSRTTDRSVILIKHVDTVIKEDNLIHQLNESINSMDWCGLVVLTSCDIPSKILCDNEIFIKIPTVFQRKDLLDGLLKDIRAKDLNTLKIAENMPGFVPRDIIKLISRCCTRAISRSLNNGIPNNTNSSCHNLASAMTGNSPSNNTSNHHHSAVDINRIDQPPSLIMDDFAHSLSDWKKITENITFDDIGALNTVKEELTMSILLPSKYPEKFLSFGINKPSGVLLYGPPGCGKTLIAKAVSNMSHCNFLSIKGPELITKYVGDSEKHLRELFQKAKNLSPCVLFFDEIDSLCGKRGKNEFGNRIVNQIVTLLDGMEDRGEVYLIGATNRIDSLDEALMRPGRFDKIIEVSLPNKVEGLEIFRKCVSKIPFEPFDFEILDFSNFSGADIAGVVKEAAIMCLKENFDRNDLKITPEYFTNAIEKMKVMKQTRRRRK